MKGLVLGSSHVAAVRSAWSKNAAIDDLDFFSILGAFGPKLRLEDGLFYRTGPASKIFSTIRNVGRTGLDLSGYDYVVVCGIGLPAMRNQFWNPLAHICLAEISEGVIPDLLPVSRAVMAEYINSLFIRTNWKGLATNVRTVFDGTILCIPTPIPSIARLDHADMLHVIYGSRLDEFTSWYVTVVSGLVRQLAEEVGMEFLDFPDQAWVGAGTTPQEYSQKDGWHMNRLYGELVLNQIVNAMDARTAGPGVSP